MDVRADLRKFIQTNFILSSVDAIEDDGSFLERNLIDSTGVLELVGHLESTYSIDVEDEEIVPENLDSINLIIGYLNRKGVAIDEAA
jgi:acyl carrier protein